MESILGHLKKLKVLKKFGLPVLGRVVMGRRQTARERGRRRRNGRGRKSSAARLPPPPPVQSWSPGSAGSSGSIPSTLPSGSRRRFNDKKK
jgi:hypothetical protein